MNTHPVKLARSQSSAVGAPSAGTRGDAPIYLPSASTSRVAALDMLRGLALVSIMLNHMPSGVLRHVTISNFFLFDAAELFVLLSGFLVGLVWRQIAARGGERAAQLRFAHRAFQVWRAMMIAAVLMAILSLALRHLGLAHTAIWNGYADLLTTRPFFYLVAVGSLWMQPNLLDVLALYTLLLAATPLVMPALVRRPWLTGLALGVLWWFAVPLNLMIPNERPDSSGLLFNPFGWQALFFIGAALGLYRVPVMQTLRRYEPWVTVGAIGVLIFGWLVLIGWRVGEPLALLRNTLFAVHGVIEKWPLDFLRTLSILAAAWLVAAPLKRAFGAIAASGAGRALAVIGKGGLVSFVGCVLLSVVGDAAQVSMAGSIVEGALVDGWVIVALWAVASLAALRPRRLA